MHFYFYYSFVSISGYRGDLNPSFPRNGEQARKHFIWGAIWPVLVSYPCHNSVIPTYVML